MCEIKINSRSFGEEESENVLYIGIYFDAVLYIVQRKGVSFTTGRKMGPAHGS
ncbi:hypothetical protein GCM10007916_28960 [Psychromonas marina]|uniref:Uncharacterized protein n=1 Tax=Psychromonas marina TaxID=88364 RepID=A0ABQ6E343_9GAMM|nr:hypothetical protein GCM10007916_28960 [Psychromonas marina]